MSFDLLVLDPPANSTLDELRAYYESVVEGEYDVLAPSDRIDRFYVELTSKFPSIDEVDEADLATCPWTIELDVSDGAVLMSIGWSFAERMAPIVAGLAHEHALVCFDPQDNHVLDPQGNPSATP